MNGGTEPTLGTEEDRAFAQEIHTSLTAVEPLRVRLYALVKPVRGSRALQSEKRHPLGHLHTTFAMQALGVALDNLLAWNLIVQCGTYPIYAHMTLLRAALEGAATARWLVDPSVDYRERIRRGAIMQLDDWRQRAAFEGAVSAATSSQPRARLGKSGAERMAEHHDAMQRSGITTERMPPITKIATDHGHLALWRMTSAFAHGSPWSALVSDLVEMPGEPLWGSRRARISPAMKYSAFVTKVAVDLVTKAVGEVESHYGVGT